MAKLRVYELARELNIESKVLVTRLKSAGIKVASHQSSLSGEEVEQARAALGGGGGGAAAPTAAKTVVKTRPKTILRRRKAEPDPEEEAPVEGAAEALAEAPAEAPVEAEPAQVVEAKPEAPEPVKEEPAPVEVAPEPVVEATPEVDSAAVKAEEEAQEKEKAEVEAARIAAIEAEAKIKREAEAAAAAAAKAEKAKEMRAASGATIVRRATEEELEELETQARRRTGRKEDSRGTRVTGIGLLNNRMGSGEDKGPADGAAPADSDTSPEARRYRESRPDRAPTKSEEEQAKEQAAAQQARTKKQRRVNSALTTRALLDKANALNTEVENEAARIRGRTVYTPQSTNRRRDLKRRKDLRKTQVTTPRAAYRVVKMGETISIGDLGLQMGVKSGEIIKKLMGMGEMMTINQHVDFETATLMAQDYKFEVKSEVQTVEDVLKQEKIEEGDLETRAPIVTVMGHVDHGKTSILDALKESDVAGGEAGGITQHIGAYAVERNGKKICFLDTPGHEAFSAMRSRGASATDIVILVVAADDGVMPQTIEAISHAKDAKVPMIVAVNKMDKPGANPEKVMTELTEHGVQSEEWGGDTQFIKCSALEKTGLDQLLEAITLQAELLELKSTSTGYAQGIVIEAHLDKGRGPVATVVVQRGTLRQGDFLVAGSELGRARAMHDHLGTELKEAGPSTPVEIIGLGGVPKAGDQINSVEDEKTAKNVADWRDEIERNAAANKSSAQSLEDLLAKVQTSETPEVPFIIKADVQGSVEAVSESILKLGTEKVKNRIIHSAAGGVTESDIMLAATSGAIVVAFNVRAARGLDELAEEKGVMIRYFSVIYDIVDAVKAVMVGTLPPIVSELTIGRAEVRKPISVPKIGTVAGSAVIDGKVSRHAHCRLIRDDIVIYEGKLSSLRRFKDDVKEVASGYECGISIEGYNDIKEGDVIEAYILEESQATL